MKRIHWENANFIVTDAGLPVATLLSLMKRTRAAWIVLHHPGWGDEFYVFRRAELLESLRSKKSFISAYVALNLDSSDASHAINVGQRPWEVIEPNLVLDTTQPALLRAVRLAGDGKVGAVGDFSAYSLHLMKHQERYSPHTPARLGSRAGWTENQVARVAAAFGRRAGKAVRTMGRKKAVSREPKPDTARPKTKPRTKPRPRVGKLGGVRFMGRREELKMQYAAGDTVPAAVAQETQSIVRIFYATDRAVQKQTADGNTKYANRRSSDGSIVYGTCDVSIPYNHETGKIESPVIWKFQFKENPEKHVVVLKAVQQSRAAFFEEMRERISRSKKPSALVFIHGYKVSFEDAAKSTAQIACDLRFPGAPILYSWPSRAAVKAYSSDAESVELTKKQLTRFLTDVSRESGATVINLIAHSMGNRALARALGDIAANITPRRRPRFRQIVLTAPDVSREEFLQLADAIRSLGDRVTIYGSSKDIPLYFSRKLNQYDRVGYFARSIMIVKDIDTIDASNVTTDFLAHSTFRKTKTVLTDLFDLIWHGNPPDERPGLKPRTRPDGKYWVFAK